MTTDPTPDPEIPDWEHVTPDAPWREGDLPDLRTGTEAEVYVAGALSTMPPFDKYHPAEALPFAKMAIKALGNLDLDDTPSEER